MALTKLHGCATTTPAIRRALQTSPLSVAKLAHRYGISPTTVQKWRTRTTVHDQSHTRHNLLTSMSALEEAVAVTLRRDLGLSVDDLTEVLRRCLHSTVSRSALYRCLKRHGVAQRPPPPAAPVSQPFAVEAEPGFVHLDVKHLTKLKGRRSSVYVGIDRATRYVYAEVQYDLKPRTAAQFLDRVHAHFAQWQVPLRVVLTDNGFEWTDRYAGGYKAQATGHHPVERWCAQWGIPHKRTGVRRPQTNGMVERFNRRVSEALAHKEKIKANAGQNCFATHEARDAFIHQFVFTYNRTRQLCLKHQSPYQLIHQHAEHNTYKGEEKRTRWVFL